MHGLLFSCRSAPFLLFLANYVTAVRGTAIVSYSGYDLMVFSQKLVPCLLAYSGIGTYTATLVTMALCMFVFLLWLRIRPLQHSSQSRGIALMQFSCVFGLQVYMILGSVQPAAVSAPESIGSWRHGFQVAMFCYVTCCIAVSLARVGWYLRLLMTGPKSKKRVASFHKSQLNESLWILELERFSAVARQTVSSRRDRVSSIVSTAKTP